MINYSDDEIFNINNNRCLTFDPFNEKTLQNTEFKNKEKLENYVNVISKGGIDEFKKLFFLKKVFYKLLII